MILYLLKNFIVIKQRELDWNERQRQREEKYNKRNQLCRDNQQSESLDRDSVAKNESFLRFTTLIDQILEQIDEEMCTIPTSTMCLDSACESGFSIEKSVLEELRIEAQKLKAWQKLSDVPTEKLVKLLAILEKNIKEVLIDDEDGTTLYPRIKGTEVVDFKQCLFISFYIIKLFCLRLTFSVMKLKKRFMN